MISIHAFTFNPFQENTYLLFDETGECVIIDPGCYDNNEREELSEFISVRKLKPVKLLNTHCHIDHVFGNHFLASAYNIGLEMNKLDLFNLDNVALVAKMYGVPGYEPSPQPSVFLNEGDVVKFGRSELEVLLVPGHAPGHIAFVCPSQKFVVSGDVLFYGSIGRTDFPGCSHDALIRSIKEKIYPLGDDFTVMSGHGQNTTVGFEKKNNPFVKPDN